MLLCALLLLAVLVVVGLKRRTQPSAPAAEPKLVACADHLNPPCSAVLSPTGKYAVSQHPELSLADPEPGHQCCRSSRRCRLLL
jgi:hypothetical protein